MSDLTWTRVRSMTVINLEDPDPANICLCDIAYSLARQCRFNGHVQCSVAEHSMHVALMAPREMMLEALLHDAAETYVGDVTVPVQNLIDGYEELYDRMERAVAQRFHLDHPWPEEIDRLDRIATQSEANRAWSGDHVDIGLGDVPEPSLRGFGFHRGPEYWEGQFTRLYVCCRDGNFDRMRSQFIREEI